MLPRFAVQGEVGYTTRDDAKLVASLDFLWRVPELIGPLGDHGGFVFYTGVGLRFSSQLTDDSDPEQGGVRIPVGVSYVSADNAMEVFAQLAPALNFVPDLMGTLSGGIGFRVGL